MKLLFDQNLPWKLAEVMEAHLDKILAFSSTAEALLIVK
jgi:hypothetical protein